jgi:hypothetical protein
VAIAADANNQLLPIAYALVESENKDSWLWFQSCVKIGVVKERKGVCIISDRNTGLLSALEIIKASGRVGLARSRGKVVHEAFGSKLLLQIQKQGLVQVIQEDVHAKN